MRMKKLLAGILILVLLLCACSCAVPVQDAAVVHFIDVGQADAILIVSDNSSVLIDAGTNSSGEAVLNYIKALGINKIDYLIGTHPHEDHIGGLDTIINGLDIENILMPRHSSNTQTYEDVLIAAKDKGLKITAAKAGGSFTAGQCLFSILAPSGEYDNTNNYSIVLRMEVGNISMLFTGDAESQSEARMLQEGAQLKSDLIKIGHHGSDTSSSPEFLQAVSPRYAVISVGEDNPYGHPSAQTLKNLEGVELYRTDLMGTITASTDGREISFSISKGSKPPAQTPSHPEQTGQIAAMPSTTTSTGSSFSPITAAPSEDVVYIGNKNTHKFHLPSCSGLPDQANRIIFHSRQEAVQAGMTPCSRCNP